MSEKSLQSLVNKGLLWQGETIGLSNSLLDTSSSKAKPKSQKRLGRFDIEEIDSMFLGGGLPFDGVHEWYLKTSADCRVRGHWFPPLLVVSAFIGSSLCGTTESIFSKKLKSHYIAWVGRRCWPTPHLLQLTMPGFDWKNHCLFLDPPDKDTLLWSSIQAIRSDAVLAVMTDASRLKPQAIRRMQLAAKETQTFSALFKPPWEQESCAYAKTKWLLQAKQQDPNDIAAITPMSWKLSLLKAKGGIVSGGKKEWNICFDENKNTLGLLPQTESRLEKQNTQNKVA